MSGSRTIIVTTKNEGPFLLEWIAYHRLIGFDNLVVFANDCEDGSDKMLEALDAAGIIRYYDNSETPEGLPADPQNRAYRRAFAMDHVKESEWAMVLDADEFFNIHAGDGTLDDLFETVGEADVISGTWCVYGNSGIVTYVDDLITDQFIRCAPKDVQVSFRHFGMKTMFRPGPVHRLGIHRPFLKGEFKRPEKPLRWLNGSGQDVTRFFREAGWANSPANKGYDLCQINHYMIKSNELFLMKRYRGTANSGDADRINFSYYDDFNSNHTEDASMRRWSDRIRVEIATIRNMHPEIAAAHDTCVAFFRQKIAALTSDLEKADKEVFDKLVNPENIAAQIAADEKWVAEARAKVAAPKPQPKPKPAAQDDDALDDDEPTVPLADAAPQWLADLRRSEHRRGFYHSDEKFAANFVLRDKEKLVISFDNLSSVNEAALSRESWGYTFYRAEGWSHLGVMSFEANWYRDASLFNWIEGMARQGFFKRFKRVLLTGTSMGAYASTAFARLIPGCTVLAFSPQSTLDTNLVPWETRFGSGRKQDWSGRFADGAEALEQAGNVYILYDPHFEQDRLHAERYQGKNIVPLATWFSHHKSALFLRRAELLKPITREAMDGTLTPQSYYKMYRERRNLPWYVNGLTEKALEAKHFGLVGHMANALERQGRVHLARSVNARLNAAKSGK